jgi:hypothetical protein
MKLQIRIIVYILLAIVYFLLTLFFMFIDSRFKINELLTTVPCSFVLINIIYTFLILKLKPILNIISAIIIPFLSLYLAFQFADLHLFSHYDAYDIATTIIANIIFPILFWEIIYQLKIRTI